MNSLEMYSNCRRADDSEISNGCCWQTAVVDRDDDENEGREFYRNTNYKQHQQQ